MIPKIKILLILLLVFLLVQAVHAVVLQSVPPGLDVVNFLISPDTDRTLNDSLLHSPEVHFFMAQKKEGFLNFVKYYLQGFILIQNNPWYLLNTVWFALSTLAIGSGLFVIFLSLLNLFETYPVFAHDIKENNVIGALLVTPLLGILGLKYLLLIITFLGFFYTKGKKRALGQLLMILLFISVLIISFVINSIQYSTTKKFREIVDVNLGNKFTPATSLKNAQDFVEKFSYVLSLQLAGEIEKAAEGYEAMLENKSDGRALINLGNCYFILGQMDRARDAYKKAIEEGMRFSGFYNLSVLEREQLNFQKADEYFNKASEIDLNRITSLKASTLYGPMVLNEYLSPLDISLIAITEGTKKIFHSGNIIFLLLTLAGIVSLSLMKKQGEGIKVCPKCGSVFCYRCEKQFLQRQICGLCFKTLVSIGLPLEQRVAHLVSSQNYRASRRRILLIGSFVFPWLIFSSHKNRAISVYFMAGLFYLLLSAGLLSRTFSFNTIGYLSPLGTGALVLAAIVYCAGVYIGYRRYKEGGF